jgi:tetratricopeptide (TPR) repeat protein
MAFKTIEVKVTEEVDTDPNLYVKRAEDFLRRNQYKDALKEMDQAIAYASTGKKWQYAFEKIKIYEAVGNDAGSSDFIKKYLANLYAQLPLADFYRVLRVLRKNNPLHAERILNQNGIPAILLEVCHSGQTTESFFIGKAREFMRKSQYVNALSCTKLVKEQFGDSSDLCLINGQIYKAQVSYSTSITHYTRAANLDQPRLEVYTEIVDVHIRLNQKTEAHNWIEKGLAAYPFNSELLHMKADLLYKANKHDECLLVLNTILEKNSTDAKAYFIKGLIYDQRKRYPLAKRNFNKAESLDPKRKAPENPERDRFLRRMKFLLTAIGILAVLMLAGQFILYKTGAIKPLVYDAYIYVDEDVLFTGETTELESDYELFPSYAKEPDITYKIADPDIAQVTSYGVIKGLKDGETAVQLVKGDKVLTSYEFKVSTPKVSKVQIEVDDNKLVVGETKQVTATAEMDFEEAESPDIKFSSSDPSIISVDQDGKMKALQVGEATIKASAGKESATQKVSSYAKVDKIGVDLPEDFQLKVGKTVKLEPIVKTTPEDGEIYPLEYSSSDTAVATVNSSGEVTGISEGEAEIVISSLRGAEKAVKISVKEFLAPEKPAELEATYDRASNSILLSWNHQSEDEEEEIEFNVYAALDEGDDRLLTTTSEKRLEIVNPVPGGDYTFKVLASSGLSASEPAVTSISIPLREEDENDEDSVSLNDGSSTGENSNDSPPAKTPEEKKQDANVANMVKQMSSVIGYWKNVSPDPSFAYDLEYAVINETSTDSRKQSFDISYLNDYYYYGLRSSFWEYAIREGWERIEGNKIFDTDGDAVIIHSPNKFTLQLRSGLRGDTTKQSFTFVRCKKEDIPSNYLKNSSVDLP